MPDKKATVTGETGESGGALDTAGRDERGRFRRGICGNPSGRPRTRFRSGMRAAALLLDEQAEALMQKAIELALAGDPVAVRFCLGRILGARRGQPLVATGRLALPAVAVAGDLAAAVTAITTALGEGRLTPDEALACAQMLDGFPRVLAAASAAAAPEAGGDEDARTILMRMIDRLAQDGELGTDPPAGC
jgi:microcystin degradation protein MlrC